MGNLYAESALNPKNLQNTYEKKLGFTNDTYTNAVDNGTYGNFIHDKAGYGLAQWTYYSRKEALLKFAKKNNKSIGDLEMQLAFLMIELTSGYKNLVNTLKSTTSVQEASNQVLFQFERPANQDLSVQQKRAQYGQKYYNEFAATTSVTFAPSMKYSDKVPPKQCLMTDSSCYRAGKTITPLGILWHSTGAENPKLSRYVQPSQGARDYNEQITLLGKNSYNTHWNQDISVGLNAFIGLTAAGEVDTIQTLPWNHRPWGCAQGNRGSCNNGWIQFEICEDNLSSQDYFNKVYEEACQLTAYLCVKFNLDPLGYVDYNGAKVPVILCHAEAHKLQLGSNHADVLHWFSRYGKTMDDVRNDVKKIIQSGTKVPTTSVSTLAMPQKGDTNMIDKFPVNWDEQFKEEEEMTQEQFNKMMDNWIAEQAKKEPGDWSAEAREWAERNGLVKGDEKNQKMYKKHLTREEFITVLYRALHRNIVD